MALTNYSPDDIKANFDGIPITGYAKGTFLQGGRDEASFSAVVGSTGDVTRVQSLNKMGKIKFTLMQSSPTNALLSARMKLDEQLGTKTGPVLVQDLNGSTFLHGAQAWIEKPADVGRADEAQNTEWTIVVAELEIVAGSATS